MPELPDVTIYCECLARRVVGKTLTRIRLASPFLLRTVDPPPASIVPAEVCAIHRVGKRIAIELVAAEPIFVVIHLMVAGRLLFKEEEQAKIPGKIGLAGFDFAGQPGEPWVGTLILTEAGTKKRASLHLVRGKSALLAMDRGGVEPLTCSRAQFADALERERHTLKRSLTDPRLFSGIGNAYSDEILHRAKLSPTAISTSLAEDAIARLHEATVKTLTEWTDRFRSEVGDGWPAKVTAFRAEMAVHGKYKHPCPDCGALVQRIAYADNETNYCARCQTGGKLLADRSLSRLLHDDWPKTLEELEEESTKDGRRQ